VPSAPTREHQALLTALRVQREHIFDALDGLGPAELRRPVLPSGWTSIGLVNHLSLDVERFWFQAVIAGDDTVISSLASSENAWEVGTELPADDVLGRYRANIEAADAILSSTSLDAAASWWPESFFGSSPVHSVRELALHVANETANHAGHLDAARELIDGRLHLVLD
jgi:uncharacterized damage-inducible protein DinB